MFNNSLAPSIDGNYESGLRQFFGFYTEAGIPPLHATPASMVRYTAGLGLLGTMAASTLQPYYSAVNKLFRDH
jgi:hypothetical protein